MILFRNLVVLLFVTLLPQWVGAQVQSSFQEEIHALNTRFASEGFIPCHETTLQMERNTEYAVWIDLKGGGWYKFFLVSDPGTRKAEVKLGLEGIGDIVTDKFKPEKEGEISTSFSFICPHSGRYLLTFCQRGADKTVPGYIAIRQRQRNTGKGYISFGW